MLSRIESTGFFAGDTGDTARIPHARSVSPRPIPDIVAVDVRIRPQDAGPLYTQSLPSGEVPEDYLRPGLIVDYYA